MPRIEPSRFVPCQDFRRKACSSWQTITSISLIVLRSGDLAVFLFYLVPLWRFHAQQMMDEKVEAFAFAVFASGAVPEAGQHNEIKGFVGLDQCMNNLHSRCRINIRVRFAD